MASSAIVTLELNEAELYDEGAIALAEVLEESSVLSKVTVQRNEISDDGARVSNNRLYSPPPFSLVLYIYNKGEVDACDFLLYFISF